MQWSFQMTRFTQKNLKHQKWTNVQTITTDFNLLRAYASKYHLVSQCPSIIYENTPSTIGLLTQDIYFCGCKLYGLTIQSSSSESPFTNYKCKITYLQYSLYFGYLLAFHVNETIGFGVHFLHQTHTTFPGRKAKHASGTCCMIKESRFLVLIRSAID